LPGKWGSSGINLWMNTGINSGAPEQAADRPLSIFKRQIQYFGLTMPGDLVKNDIRIRD
jgi:hypothetical protein